VVDILSRLQAALGDRYAFTGQPEGRPAVLGRGGMATVYLATDLRHDRLVALKVLHPELAGALGPERFLQEIRVAAQLQHPHIIALHDSGVADGLFYYVMPFVEGQSLRERLRRERQLALDDALAITGQVLSALAYAHAHGIVHRDIKPENILLSGEHAVVADFGLAQAVSAAGEERLTETGLSLGTPTYMSPEQGGGGGHLDGRADLYSLGCVLYEMLAGEPPFQGPSAQAILARHAIDPVPRLRTIRQTVPETIEQAITRALAKAPADRFTTAEHFRRALTAEERAPRRSIALPSVPRIVVVLAGAVAAIALAVAALRWQRHRPGVEHVDPGLVAVVPFRVAGANPALAYLGEGIVDLLAVKLTGEGGPRALDPRAVLSSWHRAIHSPAEDMSPGVALDIAHRLGAGRLIDGSIVGTPGHLTLTASILALPGGTIRTRAEVTGPADSLPALVDRLTAQLLAGEAGRTDLATLTSLPALRAYLDGQSALRAGRFESAFRSFDHALELDSTFALAGIGLNEARLWSGGNDSGRGLRLAWAARDRLSPRDRLIAGWGPALPQGSAEEPLAAAERVVAAVPERSESWYQLGDGLYHGGAMSGIETPLRRAAAAFRRALELDSSYAEARMHLFEIAVAEGDTAAVRRLGGLALADSGTDAADYFRWQMAYTLHDSTALAALRARFDRMNETSLRLIAVRSQEIGIPLDDARRAVAALLKRADTRAAHAAALSTQYVLALNGGRPGEALATIAEGERLHEDVTRDRLMDALYWDGDSAAALSSIREGAPWADGALEAGPDRRGQYDVICRLQQWRLAHGERATAPAAIARLRAAALPGIPAADSAAATAYTSACATLLEAWLATAGRRPDAGILVARLDSLSRRNPPGWTETHTLVLARLLEAQGNVPGALAAVRRRAYGLGLRRYLSTYLREEGRLAALAGDTAGAIRADQHYLRLRADPEPPLRAARDSVRAELARLVGER
jgi:serine/threonine-protein kinase